MKACILADPTLSKGVNILLMNWCQGSGNMNRKIGCILYLGPWMPACQNQMEDLSYTHFSKLKSSVFPTSKRRLFDNDDMPLADKSYYVMILFLASSCPVNYPFAYFGGKYCC